MRSSRPPGYRPSLAPLGRFSTHSCHLCAETSPYAQPPTRFSASRASIPIVSTTTRECFSNASSNSSPLRTAQQHGAWLWFEDRLTYDNARLPQALIVGGAALRRPPDVAIGLEALAWLGDECGLDEGMLRLPGHHGRDRDEPAPGEGDEQPLDATAFVEAELAALVATGTGSTGRARATRSTGSSAAIGSTARSTTSRPEAAATASARPTSTRTRAPNRRLPSIAPSYCSMPPPSRPPTTRKLRVKAA